MSDSVKKYYELVEDGIITPDSGIPGRPILDQETERWHLKSRKVVSEGHKRQAYNILLEYPQEAIFEAARILRVGDSE